jgi:hypothetical protein
MKGEGLNASHVMCNKWLYFYQLFHSRLTTSRNTRK